MFNSVGIGSAGRAANEAIQIGGGKPGGSVLSPSLESSIDLLEAEFAFIL